MLLVLLLMVVVLMGGLGRRGERLVVVGLVVLVVVVMAAEGGLRGVGVLGLHGLFGRGESGWWEVVASVRRGVRVGIGKLVEVVVVVMVIVTGNGL